MTSSADIRERLSDIWAAWGLAPDEPTSQAQHRALDAVVAWLDAGKNDPEIAIRAVQLLLADPERPGLRQRQCWVTLRKALKDAWASAGSGGKDHFLYAQALLLAAWSSEREDGFLTVKQTLDSAWSVRRGQSLKELNDWRISSVLVKQAVHDIGIKAQTGQRPPTTITAFTPENLQFSQLIKQLENQNQSYVGQIMPSLVELFKAQAKAIATTAGALRKSTEETAAMGSMLATAISNVTHIDVKSLNAWTDRVGDALSSNSGKLDLLWWGQARYCRALQKPYRRMKSDSNALLWWTAREAAELSLSLDIEPAAAYLVETLCDLGQDVDEKKPVIEWMAELHAALEKSRDKLPKLSKCLDEIAGADALGLPVTWIRRRLQNKDGFDRDIAKDDIALLLDEEIDRGDWASWIFRETLLDLRLADEE